MSTSFMNVRCARVFRESEYMVSANVPLNKNLLQIEIRCATEQSIWRGEYTSQYIEDLTEKTGQRKSFFEFLQLVGECLGNKMNQSSNRSSFDVLTYQDLKDMNNPNKDSIQKTDQSSDKKSNQNSESGVNRQNKRYLIITTIGGDHGDDKVHYPLSLSGEMIQDIESLRSVIINLQAQIQKQRNCSHSDGIHDASSILSYSDGFKKQTNSGSMNLTNLSNNLTSSGSNSNMLLKQLEQFRLENELLRAKVKRVEEYFAQKQGAVEIELAIQQKFTLEGEMDKVRVMSAKRISELENEVETKERQLISKRQENIDLQKQLTQSVCETQEGSSTRAKVQLLKLTEESETQLVQHKKTILKQKQEIEKLRIDVEKAQVEEKKFKSRISQLEIELTNSQKRSNSLSNPLAARGSYSGNSSHSSLNSRRSSPNNSHPNKLGYSSPSIHQRTNSGAKLSSPVLSKNSLYTQKTTSSFRSSSTNSKFLKNVSPGGSNNRMNKFFGSNSNQYNNIQGVQTNNNSFNDGQSENNNVGIQNQNNTNTSFNSRTSSNSNPSLGRGSNSANRRQPLYNVDKNVTRPLSITIKSIKQPTIDTIPENKKYNQMRQTPNHTPSSQYPTSQNRTSSSYRPSSNNSNAPYNKYSNNPTQPRISQQNNYMKQLNRGDQALKPSQQSNQLRQHAQIQEKIDYNIFDDKHILNIQHEQKTELEMKIDKLQNILQVAKDDDIDAF